MPRPNDELRLAPAARWMLAVACISGACTHQGRRNPERDPDCLAFRGCAPSNPLPKCVTSDTLSIKMLGSIADGTPIATRGRLQVGERSCSQIRCPGHCCNSCRGKLSVYDSGQHVELVGKGIEAIGDDSADCLRTGTLGQEIVAHGTLHVLGNGKLQIQFAELCAL